MAKKEVNCILGYPRLKTNSNNPEVIKSHFKQFLQVNKN